jgi:hypothetical protein
MGWWEWEGERSLNKLKRMADERGGGQGREGRVEGDAWDRLGWGRMGHYERQGSRMDGWDINYEYWDIREEKEQKRRKEEKKKDIHDAGYIGQDLFLLFVEMARDGVVAGALDFFVFSRCSLGAGDPADSR